MYYVYVLYSECDAGLYIGYTCDLRRRVDEHRRGESYTHVLNKGPLGVVSPVDTL